MNETPSEDALLRSSWCDVTLLGMHWAEGGRDLVLTLELSGADTERKSAKRVLRCRWASNVRVNLSPRGAEGGPPMTWEGSTTRTLDRGWSVHFDFAHRGELSLACSELELKAPS